jgi:flagellar hook-length control protein FliK
LATGEELLAVASPDATEPTDEGTKAAADKSKRSKVRPSSAAAASTESSGEADGDKSSQPAATTPLALPQQSESDTESDSPQLSALHRSPTDDSTPATVAKVAIAAIAENLQPPPEPSGPAASPAVDPPVTAAQPDSHPAGGVAATTLKPPAAFLKSKTTHHDAARPAGELDPARFMSRVVNAFESAHQRGSEVRLRLHPVELGALSIEIKIQDNTLTASVQAETTEAKAAIVDNLPTLRERLAEQGIRIDQFDVDLMDHSDRRQQSLEEQTRRQDDRQAHAPRSANRRTVASEPSAVSSPRPRSGGQNGLNVVI